MQAGGEAIYKAVETVGRARDAVLGVLVAEHLESYPPGQSAALLSKLYLALGRHDDAAAAALHAAHIEQQAGNYKVRYISQRLLRAIVTRIVASVLACKSLSMAIARN